MARGLAITVAAVVLGTAAVASPAHAYERSTVDRDPSTPLFWRYRWVTVRPAYDTCADVPAEAIRLAVARSVGAWNVAAEPCSDFRIQDGGPPAEQATNLVAGEHDGENRIVWREDRWPEEVPADTLALTTLVYRRASGQILDADIDLNGVNHFWTDTTEPGRADTDVQNTLTHELGHLLGLAHAPDPAATMYRESSPGDLDKRTLSEDDVAGLCYIYPTRVLSPDAPRIRGQALSSCSAATSAGSLGPFALWLGALLAWAARRARGDRLDQRARSRNAASEASRSAGRNGLRIQAKR